MKIRCFNLLLVLTLLLPGAGTIQAAARSDLPTEIEAAQRDTNLDVREETHGAQLVYAENVEFVGHIGGTTQAVAVQGNYAYIGEGPRLTILDITNPAVPAVIGKTTPFPDVVLDVYVAGGYAYVANSKHGLRVVDVSDPIHPTEVGCVIFEHEYAEGVYVSGSIAYIAAGYSLKVVDVSDPTYPTEIGYISLGWASDVHVSGSIAYVAAGMSGLRVVDVSDPAHPTEVGFYDPSEHDMTLSVFVSGNIAYMAEGIAGYRLRIVDVSDPTHPTEISAYPTGTTCTGVYVSGSIAYIINISGELRVVDVSNPGLPVGVGFYDTPGEAYGVVVSGSTVYIADYSSGLQMVDVSDPAHPTEIGFYDPLGYTTGVVVSDNTAYVADYSGLRMVDVSDPAHLTEIGFCDAPGHANDIYISSHTAYVVGSSANYNDGWLQIVDINDPAHPTAVGICNMPWYAMGVFVSGNYAYVADHAGGLRVVDVSDPTHPTEVGFDDTYHATSVYVSGSVAYVTDYIGLRVVDVSNPAYPTTVGFYNTGGGDVRDVYVSGSIAYVAAGYRGLRVVDVSDPAHPTEIGFASAGSVTRVDISGSIAYIASAGYDQSDRLNGNLHTIDVSDPTYPIKTGFYDTPGGARNVTVNDSIVYVADGEGGLLVLRYTEPLVYPSNLDFGVSHSEMTLLVNPKNPTDTWTLSENLSWLSLDHTSGMGRAIVTANVERDGLSPNTYTGAITAIVEGETAMVNVTMTLAAPDVTIITPSPGSTVYHSDSLLVKAAVTLGGQALVGGQVKGSILLGYSGGKPVGVPIPMYDDGNHEDGSADDGTYAARITLYGAGTMPTTGNPYSLTVTATANGASGSDTTSINMAMGSGAPSVNLETNGPSAPDYFAGEQIAITATLTYPDSSIHTDTAVTITITAPDLGVTRVGLTNVTTDTWRGTYTFPADQGSVYYLDVHADPPTGSGFVDGWGGTKIEVYRDVLSLNVTIPPGTYYRNMAVPLNVCVTASGQQVEDAKVNAEIMPEDQGLPLTPTIGGCYSGNYYPSESGVHLVAFTAHALTYKSGNANDSFTVSADKPALADAVTEFADSAVGWSEEVMNVSEDIAEAGDWFATKIVSDKTRMMIEFGMDAISIVQSGVDVRDKVALSKMGLPGACQAGTAEDLLEEFLWDDVIHSISRWTSESMDDVFMSFAQAPHRYYATGGSPNIELDSPRDYIEERYTVIVPGNQGLRSYFYGPLNSSSIKLQTGIQSRTSEVVGSLSPLTVEQEAEYINDLVRRQSAHNWLAYYDLFVRSDLMFEMKAKREYMEQDEFRKFILFLSEMSLKLVILSKLGHLGEMATDSFLMAYHAYVNNLNIEQDQHFRDIAIGLMEQAHGAQAFIGSNTLSGLNLIEQATPPQTPAGEIISTDLVRTAPEFPLNFYTRDVYADLQIENTGDVAADYGVVAYYSVAKGPGSYRQTFREMSDPTTGERLSLVSLSPGSQSTVRMYFKNNKGDLGTPKYGAFFVLYALTDWGVYVLDVETIAPFEPRTETSALTAQMAIVTPASLQAADVTPALSLGNSISETERYPVWAMVGGDIDQFTYTLNIAADNPFPMPLAVVISQTIPSTVNLIDPGEGTVSGSEITWYRVIQPRETIILQYTFDYGGDYAAEATLPPVYLSFYDAADDVNITLNTDSIAFYARSPLRARGTASTITSPGVQQTVHITVTNLDNGSTQQGDLRLHVRTGDGTEITNATTHVSLGASMSQNYDLNYTVPDEGLYVLEVSLHYGDETMPLIYDLLSVRRYRIYLPLVLRNYTPGSGSTNQPPNAPSNPTPTGGAIDQSVDVNLTWTGGDPDGDSVTYDVYFEADDSTPDALLCNDVTSVTCDPGTLSLGTHYYWQVIARDSHGATTTGPVWDFTTSSPSNIPPNTPSSPSPTDSAVNQPVVITLSWTGDDPDGDSVTYDVFLDTSTPPTTPICNDVPAATCFAGTLNFATHYYWYVVATDEYSATTTGPVWDFATISSPEPDIAVTPAFVNITLGLDKSITDTLTITNAGGAELTWSLTESPAASWLSESQNSGSIASGASATEVILTFDSTGLVSTTYTTTLQITSNDPDESQVDVAVTLTVTNQPPNEPSAPSPANGAANQPITTTLSWSGGDPDGDSVTYDVYFQLGSAYLLVCADVTSASCDPGTLSPGTHYYWQVVATDEHGATTAGPVWDFTSVQTCHVRINDDPMEYSAVQAAVDRANVGDVVKVAGYCADVNVRPRNDITTTGVVTQVVYISKTVTIRGGYTTTNWATPDPLANPTTLDAQGQGRVFYVTGSVSPTIEGLQITRGNGNYGGGVYVITATVTLSNTYVFNNTALEAGGLALQNSVATLNHNIISSNTSRMSDGGISLSQSNATLNNNIISSNTSKVTGGGIALGFSEATLTGNTISDNTTVRSGGGLWLYKSKIVLEGNIISGNTADYGGGMDWGGGMFLSNSSATLNGNTVTSNTADYGGGLNLEISDITLNGNTISGNIANDYGGGLYLMASDYALINNNLVTANTAQDGGGIYLDRSDATLVNNLVADNIAEGLGSGVYIKGCSPHLLHTTLARNIGGDGSGVYVTHYEQSSPFMHYSSMARLTNTILVSHTVGITVTTGNTATLEATLWGAGTWANETDWGGTGTIITGIITNIWGDPAFVDPDSGDYHIGPGSAALDAGVDAGVTSDIDGQTRPQGAGYDIGADEYVPVAGLRAWYTSNDNDRENKIYVRQIYPPVILRYD